MLYQRIFMFLALIILIATGCTPRDSSLVYRPEKLEPPVERPLEIDTECETEDCPPPSDGTEIDEILVDNFDPYGSGEVGVPVIESPEFSEPSTNSELIPNQEVESATDTELSTESEPVDNTE